MTNRTTETEVGFLSKLVTRLWTMKAEAVLKNIEEDGMDPDLAIDTKFVQALGKWVLDNGVFAAPDAADTESPLSAQLRAIKERSGKKVLDFKGEAAEAGKG